MRHLPYVIGLFMATPLVLWAVLWGFAFPGPKAGFDSAGPLAMLAVSVPLVVYFLLANLGMMANSMAGHTETERPLGRGARRLARVLPVAAGLGGATAVALVVAAGAPALEIAAVAVLAVVVTGVLARAIYRRPRPPAARSATPVPAAPSAVPIAPAAPPRAEDGRLPWLLVNAILLVALATLSFGVVALLVAAIVAVPVVFAVLIWLTWWGCDAPAAE
jgi:hypothetical protein